MVLSRAIADFSKGAARRFAQSAARSSNSALRDARRPLSILSTLREPVYEAVGPIPERPGLLKDLYERRVLDLGPAPDAKNPDSRIDFNTNPSYLDIPLDHPIDLSSAASSASSASASSSGEAGTADNSSSAKLRYDQKLNFEGLRFSKLENGARVVSYDKAGLGASVGLFLRAGSRFENQKEQGCTQMLEELAFRNTKHFSNFGFAKTLERLGAHTHTTVGREHIFYRVDLMRDCVPLVVPLLLSNVMSPDFLPEELEEVKMKLFLSKEMMLTNADSAITELIHQVAYGGQTLGSPILAEDPMRCADNLGHFHKRFAVPGNVVVCGVNTDHKELRSLVVESFADLQASANSTTKNAEEADVAEKNADSNTVDSNSIKANGDSNINAATSAGNSSGAIIGSNGSSSSSSSTSSNGNTHTSSHPANGGNPFHNHVNVNQMQARAMSTETIAGATPDGISYDTPPAVYQGGFRVVSKEALAQAMIEAQKVAARNAQAINDAVANAENSAESAGESGVQSSNSTDSSAEVQSGSTEQEAEQKGVDQQQLEELLMQQAGDDLAHIAVGFHVPGGWSGEHLVAATVLQALLGGGGSFSTGGPGKGMHSRLFTTVLNRHYWVESCMAFSNVYSDSGIFGLYGMVNADNSRDFLTVMGNVFTELRHFTDLEVQRAKNSLKSAIFMNLETNAVAMEDLGRQLLMCGKMATGAEFAHLIDQVTADDLVKVSKTLLESKPTLIYYGNTQQTITQEEVEAMFKAARLKFS